MPDETPNPLVGKVCRLLVSYPGFSIGDLVKVTSVVDGEYSITRDLAATSSDVQCVPSHYLADPRDPTEAELAGAANGE